MKIAAIRADKLALVASVESFRKSSEPPLFTGNWVRLNSGGPRLLVVDAAGEDVVVVGWRNSAGAHEQQLPATCLHRVS